MAARQAGWRPQVQAITRTPGRLAQLGERQLDKLEVTGSSPVAPIPGFGTILSGRDLQVTARTLRGVRVVGVVGELDIATSPDLRDLLAKARDDADLPLVIDLTGCAFIDSTGLAALLHGAGRERAAEGKVALVSSPGEVRKLLELTAIDRTLPVFETLDEAIEAVSPPA
jgi:anti-sigma B factor antagonist